MIGLYSGKRHHGWRRCSLRRVKFDRVIEDLSGFGVSGAVDGGYVCYC